MQKVRHKGTERGDSLKKVKTSDLEIEGVTEKVITLKFYLRSFL